LEIDASNTETVNQDRIDNSIGKLEDLRKLCIERCSNQLRFHSLQKLANLESLSLYDCIKIEELSFLGSAKKLKRLCLSKCMLSESGFDVLASLHHLKRLYLWHTSAQDLWVAKLTQLTNLDTLDISGNPNLTNACTENFSNLKNLTLLDTSNTTITVETILELKKSAKDLQVGYKELYGNPLMQRSKKMKLF